MAKKWLIGIVLLAGAVLAGFAFLANQFGLDPENDWGAGRVIVAVTGIFFVLIAGLAATWGFWSAWWDGLKKALARVFLWFLNLPVVRGVRQAIRTTMMAFSNSRLGRWLSAFLLSPIRKALARLRASRLVRYFADSQDRLAALVAGILAVAVLTILTWFVSVGYWTEWPRTTAYYDQLAEAFLHGQTSLLAEPSPALLALEDPYVYENRQNVSYPWDTVLFNGKFYYYYGPAPALLLALAKTIYRGVIGDQVIVFAFVSGIFLFSSFLLLRVRSRLFPDLSWLYVIPAIAIAGMANPLPWLLNRPQVYEAAISGGQFFLMAGLYVGFSALDGKAPQLWKVGVMSALWLLAVASRMTLVPAVGFLLVMSTWRLFSQVKGKGSKLFALLVLSLPFAAGLVGLGWYNFDRFGSWLETGYRYQLTGKFVNSPDVHVFTLANFLSNLHNYFLNPFRSLDIFPYIKPNWGGHFIFFPIPGSEYSTSEQVTGLLMAVPYFLLASVLVVYLFKWGGKLLGAVLRKIPMLVKSSEDAFLPGWLLAVSGACLLSFTPFLLYMTSTMRYAADGVPLLSLMSTMGFWLVARSLAEKPGFKGWFVILVTVLAIASVVLSLLLAVTGYQARFEHLNPLLFDRLTRLLPPY